MMGPEPTPGDWSPPSDDLKIAMLQIRLTASQSAQQRSRFVLLVSTIVSSMILIASWNAYFSWDQRFALLAGWSTNPVTEEAERKSLDTWIESQMVSLPVFGIRISSADTAVLGSISLMVICVWFFFSIRRENHTIGVLLMDTQREPSYIRSLVFHGVVSYLVLTTVSLVDTPVRSLKGTGPRAVGGPAFFVRPVVKGLFFLPSASIFIIIALDILSVFYFPAYFRHPHVHLWKLMDTADILRSIAYKIIPFILGLVSLYVNVKSMAFESATGAILREYWDDLKHQP